MVLQTGKQLVAPQVAAEVWQQEQGQLREGGEAWEGLLRDTGQAGGKHPSCITGQSPSSAHVPALTQTLMPAPAETCPAVSPYWVEQPYWVPASSMS